MLIVLRPEGPSIAGEAMTAETLTRHVTARLSQKPEQRIVIRPTGGTKMQPLVALLDHLAALGARDVALAPDDRSAQ